MYYKKEIFELEGVVGMGLINVASSTSVWRGLDYCKENKVISYSKINNNQYQ